MSQRGDLILTREVNSSELCAVYGGKIQPVHIAVFQEGHFANTWAKLAEVLREAELVRLLTQLKCLDPNTLL